MARGNCLVYDRKRGTLRAYGLLKIIFHKLLKCLYKKQVIVL